MDLMEELYGSVHISGAEGWSAQQGENHLDTMMPETIHESDDASESRQNDPPLNQETDVSHNAPSSSNAPRAKRKRRATATQAVADVIRDSIQSRDEILSHKNQLIENHPDYSCSQLRAMRVLHSFSSIRMWSPLYKAAIQHLKKAPTNRQTFLSYEDDENKDIFRFLTEDDDMDLILDEEENMYAAVQETCGVMDINLGRQIHRTNRGGGWRRVQRFMFESEKKCFDILRMNQGTFMSLCQKLSEQYKLKESQHVYIEESVAMFIEMVAQDLTVRVLAERYQHSLDTVKMKLDEVLSVLLKLAADIVKPTRGEFTSASPVMVNDQRYWPYFRNCIGALDGTHVPVRPPSQNVEPYRGRKAEATMNVLAICNFHMKFIYSYVGVPGRAHDTKVLTHCATQEPSFPHPPDGKYYLVDSGYPTRTGYLGPHRRIRYHLDQFVRGGPPTNTRELFNRKHSGLRSVIERTFGVWKAKWRILDRKHPKYELKKWIKIVTATMALHNFIRDSHHEDRDFAHWEAMEEYEHHGDQVVENDEDNNNSHIGHIPYIPVGDKALEVLRDSITEEIARGRRLPY